MNEVPAIITYLTPGGLWATTQILVALPALSRKEQACADVFADVATQGSKNFSPMVLSRIWTRDFSKPVCSYGPCGLRYSFTVPSASLAEAVKVAIDQIQNATLDESAISNSLFRKRMQSMSPWSSATSTFRPDFSALTRSDLVAFAKKYLRASEVVIGLGGAFDPAAVETVLSETALGWKNVGKTQLTSTIPVSTLDEDAKVWCFESVPMTVSADALPKLALVATALGVGKGSFLFRVIRNENGWSYRQDGMLVPTSTGFGFRIVLQHEDQTWKSEELDELWQKDVENWSDSYLQRCKVLLRATTANEFLIGPLWLAWDKPISAGLEDQTYLRTFWRLQS